MWYVTVLLLFALCPNRKWELLSLVTWKINVHIFLPPNLTELFNYLTSYSIFTPTAFFLLWIHLPASVFLAVSWLFDSTRQPPQPHLEKSLCCSLLSGETLYFLVTLPQPWQSLVRKSNSALLKSHPRLTEGNLSASQQMNYCSCLVSVKSLQRAVRGYPVEVFVSCAPATQTACHRI